MRGYRALHERPDPRLCFPVAVALCLPARFFLSALKFLLGAPPLFCRLALHVHASRPNLPPRCDAGRVSAAFATSTVSFIGF
jgi:hypothetical protein